MNFNSHAHVERDRAEQAAARMQVISTHTLTWSVTSLPTALEIGGKISTHTLTWSVTEWGQPIFDGINISTHTLTWSVTRQGVELGEKAEFQLTRSRGA